MTWKSQTENGKSGEQLQAYWQAAELHVPEQKSALRIIFPDCSYESALVRCGLPTLLSRRDEACRRFISNIKESGFLSHLLPQPTNVAHGYGLRSGFSRSEFRFVRTDRLSNFVTHSYNRI